MWALVALAGMPSAAWAADRPTPRTETSVRTIEARGDVDLEPLVAPPPAPVATPPAEATAPVPQERRVRLGLGIGVGPLVSSKLLRVGLAARAEASLTLHEVSERLALLAYAGSSFASGQGPVTIPGRGHDPALRVSRQTFSFALGARVDAFRDDSQAVSVSLAYAPAYVRQSYGALGLSSREAGVSNGGIAAVGYRRRLGPGEAGLSVEGGLGSARLGKLGTLATDPFSSLSAVFSYSFAAITTESP